MSVYISDVGGLRKRESRAKGWDANDNKSKANRRISYSEPRELNKALLRPEEEIRKDLARMLEKQLRAQRERWSRYGL